MFEIDNLNDGYVVKEPYHAIREAGEPTRYYPTHYVMSYRKGVYKYTTDYTYAKRFTKATARKHADTLNERS